MQNVHGCARIAPRWFEAYPGDRGGGGSVALPCGGDDVDAGRAALLKMRSRGRV
jgi:hypothetical protein